MIRPAVPSDRDAIARICLVTGADGGDATGVHGDDALLADVYALPYLEGPGGFALVWDEGLGPLGYVLGTADTRAFQAWFVEDWWVRRAPHHVARTPAARALAAHAQDPGRMLVPQVEDYPAHLHIDLLPEAQGRGAGRALIQAACGVLSAAGAHGVHLVASRANEGAVAFYPRVGFTRIGWDEGSVTFARRLG